MLHTVLPQKSDHSQFSSSEFEAKEVSTDTESSEENLESEINAEDLNRAESSVDNTSDNTLDYDLSQAISDQFYFESSLTLWPLFVHREFIREKRIDMDSYERQNMLKLLQERGILSTVTTAMPFCNKTVLEFFSNLSEKVGHVESVRYRRVYVRNHIYSFSPSCINEYFHTEGTASLEPVAMSIDEVTSIITGGLVTHFPTLPHRLAAASLTSLYSVLHKTAICNWTPSTNSTIVTRPQAMILFAIGMGKQFDFGQHVFNTVMSFATGGQKSTKLPFPSLIFGLLESQGFVATADDVFTGEADVLKLAPALLKGNRKIDLPWSAPGVVPSVTNTAHNTTTPSTQDPKTSFSTQQKSATINVPTEFLTSQLEFAMQQIEYYTEQAALIHRMIEDSGPSRQQGEVE